jgi:hypothetical protein
MPRPDDLSRSLVALQQDSTLIAVIELSQSSWLVAGIVPGLSRHPLKNLEPDREGLLRLLRRWREEAGRTGRAVTRVAIAFEAGRDGFCLARWLGAHEIEAHVTARSNALARAILPAWPAPRQRPVTTGTQRGRSRQGMMVPSVTKAWHSRKAGRFGFRAWSNRTAAPGALAEQRGASVSSMMAKRRGPQVSRRTTPHSAATRSSSRKRPCAVIQ